MITVDGTENGVPARRTCRERPTSYASIFQRLQEKNSGRPIGQFMSLG